MLPDDVAAQVLEGMLGADLLGFHTERWAGLFEECCRQILGRGPDGRLGVFGLTTDADELLERAHQRDVNVEVRALREQIGDCLVIGRVDRTELSKNVFRGLLAYREMLRRWPEWHGKVVHAVFDYPSREEIPEYREYVASVERLGREIDDEFGTEDWSPLLLSMDQEYPAALAALRLTNVVFVNSVRDGMNLVVLEAIVLAEQEPIVVLSRETGAAALPLGGGAMLVNPYDVGQTAEALNDALGAIVDGRQRAGVAQLRKAATQLPPTKWFEAQLDALAIRAARKKSARKQPARKQPAPS
jgi:trehalose 6-phosphate synthase